MDNLRENHKEFIKSNKLIVKSEQRLGSQKYNAFTEELNKIRLIANDVKRLDSIETNAYGTNKELIHKKEEIKCNNLIKQCKND